MAGPNGYPVNEEIVGNLAIRKVGDDGLYGNLTVEGTINGNIVDITNVKHFGAVGDGTTDDTVAIQAAIDAAVARGGGSVFVPEGTYLISSALTLDSFVSLVGEGIGSKITQSSTTADCVTGTTLQYVTIRDIFIDGPDSGSGRGIYFSDGGNSSNQNIVMQNVVVSQFGSHGIVMETPIISNLIGVNSQNNGGHGFYMTTSTTGGTSVSFNACFANDNPQAGFHLNQLHYSSMQGCAADACGIGYLLATCQSTVLSGCGSELMVATDATYDGTAFKLSGGNTCALVNCYNYQNKSKAVWLTSSQNQTQIQGFRENTPSGTATVGIQVDSTCQGVTLTGNKTTTANSITTGTTTRSPSNAWLPDDHGLVAWNGDPAYSTSGNTLATGGTVYLARINIRQPATITKLWYANNAAGVTPTAGQNEIGLYNSAGTLVTSVNIDATITGTGPQSGTISATALTPGFYWIGVVFNAGTAPTLARGSASIFGSNIANLSASTTRWATNGTGATVLPASITPASNSTSGATAFWVAVS